MGMLASTNGRIYVYQIMPIPSIHLMQWLLQI